MVYCAQNNVTFAGNFFLSVDLSNEIECIIHASMSIFKRFINTLFLLSLYHEARNFMTLHKY